MHHQGGHQPEADLAGRNDGDVFPVYGDGVHGLLVGEHIDIVLKTIKFKLSSGHSGKQGIYDVQTIGTKMTATKMMNAGKNEQGNRLFIA